MKKVFLIMVMVLLLIVLVGCQYSSEVGNLNQSILNNSKEVGDLTTPLEVENKIAELAEIWANALITRDGKPRYEMMSEKAKAQFEQEQITRSGENWNYNIGDSSPWVVSFNIDIDGMTAFVHYDLQTSEPANYQMKEIVTFVKDKDDLVVEDYQTISE